MLRGMALTYIHDVATGAAMVSFQDGNYVSLKSFLEGRFLSRAEAQ
jgi:hypothetical protein